MQITLPDSLIEEMRHYTTLDNQSEAVANIIQEWLSYKKTQINESTNAWDVLDELTGSIDAPSDWSSQHNHYLYGTPKKVETGRWAQAAKRLSEEHPITPEIETVLQKGIKAFRAGFSLDTH